VKLWTCFSPVCISLLLLAGCAAETAEETPGQAAAPEEAAARLEARIADGAETGELLLAGEDGRLYALSVRETPVTLDGSEAAGTDLRDGMRVTVCHSGSIQETYPARFGAVSALEAESGGTEDRCGLYLRVLEDLWNTDSGLNDGITQMGMDLSQVTDLTQGEKAAVIWRFGENRGLAPIQGTFDELAEAGYIDREHLVWKDGVLFTLSGSAEEGFDAEKWRSGTGAHFFTNCIAKAEDSGAWDYAVGAEAVS